MCIRDRVRGVPGSDREPDQRLRDLPRPLRGNAPQGAGTAVFPGGLAQPGIHPRAASGPYLGLRVHRRHPHRGRTYQASAGEDQGPRQLGHHHGVGHRLQIRGKAVSLAANIPVRTVRGEQNTGERQAVPAGCACRSSQSIRRDSQRIPPHLFYLCLNAVPAVPPSKLPDRGLKIPAVFHCAFPCQMCIRDRYMALCAKKAPPNHANDTFIIGEIHESKSVKNPGIP